jgi:hypothetical protein
MTNKKIFIYIRSFVASFPSDSPMVTLKKGISLLGHFFEEVHEIF